MSVLINFKICDNSKECDGIANCPTGALFWDEDNNRIGITNEKCISCGACSKVCPIGAIKVAKNSLEYEKIKKEIDDDPRSISDLFIERYGAMPVHPDVLISYEDLEKEINVINKSLLVELFRDDDVMCLRKSVPIRELIPGEDIVFRKVRVDDESEAVDKYNILKFPCLIFLKNGRVRGKVEGYFGEDEIEKLKIKIRDIIS